MSHSSQGNYQLAIDAIVFQKDKETAPNFISTPLARFSCPFSRTFGRSRPSFFGRSVVISQNSLGPKCSKVGRKAMGPMGFLQTQIKKNTVPATTEGLVLSTAPTGFFHRFFLFDFPVSVGFFPGTA